MRKSVWSGRSIVMAAGLCLFGSVAVADDATSLVSKIEAATSAATSYQIDFTGPGDTRASMAFVRGVGSQYHTTSASADMVSYSVGTTMYQSVNGGAWLKIVMNPNDVAALTKSVTRHRSAELLANRIEDGVTVGAIKTEVTAMVPGLNPSSHTLGPAVCTYDKATFLFRMCKTDHITMRYSRYDDPSLTIEVPAEARNAVEIVLPAVAPQPVRSPG